MLVLSRYPGESIKIGNEMKITVKEIANKKATLTVNNPYDQTLTLAWDQSAKITDNIKIDLI